MGAGKQSTFNVEGKGKVKIQMSVNGVKKNITFEDALYTPNLRSNLISLSKLAEKGTQVEFDKDRAQVKTKDGQIVITAKRRGQLYVVDDENSRLEVHTMQVKH